MFGSVHFFAEQIIRVSGVPLQRQSQRFRYNLLFAAAWAPTIAMLETNSIFIV